MLLDFWTSACANCLHVVPELHRLEQQFADVLTVVGVHSPKFPHEAGDEAVTAAIERAGIAHPVLADPDLALWRQYAVRAWPTLVLVDPEGYVVAQVAGEGHGRRLAELIADAGRRATSSAVCCAAAPGRPSGPSAPRRTLPHALRCTCRPRRSCCLPRGPGVRPTRCSSPTPAATS